MAVNITTFRRDLFHLADQALQGESVEFVHKGVVFQVIPETKPSNLSKLHRESIVAPGTDVSITGLMKEVEAEWQKDWSEI